MCSRFFGFEIGEGWERGGQYGGSFAHSTRATAFEPFVRERYLPLCIVHAVFRMAHRRARRSVMMTAANLFSFSNECKRRKIKCNGETPCLRCGNLNLECQYAPNCCTNGGFKESDEFRQMNAHIKSLQEQVDNLYANLNAIKNDSNLIQGRNENNNIGYMQQQERGTSHGPLPPIDPVPRYRPVGKKLLG